MVAPQKRKKMASKLAPRTDKPKKIKIWSTNKCDAEFSREIRARDKKCLRCGSTERLTCSHYFSKGSTSTRYDPENCITLCYRCHYGSYYLTEDAFQGWEYDREGGYREYMINWLGEEKFQQLKVKAHTFQSLENARQEYQERKKV